jgi:hypothetical protein
VKCKTQKLVFFAIAAISCLLLTCAPFAAGDYGESGGGITYTDVEYSPDGGSITVYLDGSKPVRQSRALNLNNAKYGHDLFAVAFYRREAGRVTIARAVWEKGQAAGVNGVVRNVDYRYANIPAIPSDSPTVKFGAAIIFVGKKSDKTLLAVGKLTGTNENPTATLVTENTRSVTFSVYAFNSGTSDDADHSSFHTAALQNIGAPGGAGSGTPLTNAIAGNTDVVSIMFGKLFFPLYRLNKNLSTDPQVINAVYRFDVYSGNFSDFHGGILQYAAPPYNIPSLATMESTDHLRPRYPRGDGTWEYDILAERDGGLPNGTGLTITSTSPNIDGSFQNPVEFEFISRTGMDGRVFAFSFQVPVFPLTNLDERGLHDPWFLRPGYDSHWYDLDNGEGGNGGAILIGTGNIEDTLEFDISIVRSPIKKFYGPGVTPATAEAQWAFRLNGIRVDFIAGNGDFSYVVEPLYLLPGDIADGRVEFFIGSVDPSNKIIESSNLQSLLTLGGTNPNPAVVVDGVIDVWVVFHGDGKDYIRSFAIYFWEYGAAPPPDSGSIPSGNRKIIASADDLLTFSNLPGGGNYLLVFFDSIDLSQITLNGTSTIVLVAAAPGVVLGRSDANAVFQVNGPGNTSLLYLGLWPFSDALVVDGIPITSHPLTINAAGSCLPPYPNTHGASGYFINTQSNNVTVTRGPGLIVHNSGRFSNVSGL